MSYAVTAFVTAYKRIDQTLDTLRKLQECQPPPAEILVHVDGNQAACAAAISEAFPDIRVLLSEANLGPGGARNKLMAAASHSIVASFDDDSYPLDSDFFFRLCNLFTLHPEASIIAACVIERGTAISLDSNGLQWVADFPGGACAFRKQCFLDSEGYVPLPLAYGMEEVDLALRLHALGGRVLRTGSLRVFHDTDLSRHGSPQITSASLRNIALLTYLRYPIVLWPLGVAQYFNRIVWLIRHGRWRGIVSGIVAIPATLVQNNQYVRRVAPAAVYSYLRLRHNPIPLNPKTNERGAYSVQPLATRRGQ